MTELTALWLPILLSAVVVFIVSSVIHMAMPWHKNDYAKVPDEDKVMEALRPFNIPPNDYMMPRPSGSHDLKSAEFMEKMNKGPVIIMTVRSNGKWNMGMPLFLWLVYSLVVGFFAAYITSHALPVGAEYIQVFRFIGATAFMGYAFAYVPMSIWYGRAWSSTVKMMFDGLIYALLSAGIFGWLWPR